MIFGEPQADGVKVIVVVATKSTISEVVITGATRVKVSRLRDEITAKSGDPLSESALEADRQKIIEYYQKKGYGDVDVRYRTTGDDRKGTSKVLPLCATNTTVGAGSGSVFDLIQDKNSSPTASKDIA